MRNICIPVILFLFLITPSIAGDVLVFDRFGKEYKPVKGDKLLNSETEEAGIFELRFIKEAEDRGFFDPDIEGVESLGEKRRRVIIECFKDVSRLFVRPEGSGPVKIDIYGSGAQSGAAPSPLYSVLNGEKSGLIDSHVRNAIVSGQTPIDIARHTETHGYIKFNFNYQFNLDIDKEEFDEYDLYTVTLHEIFHLLGFGSLIGSEGLSRLNMLSGGFYSRFDLLLNYHK